MYLIVFLAATVTDSSVPRSFPPLTKGRACETIFLNTFYGISQST